MRICSWAMVLTAAVLASVLPAPRLVAQESPPVGEESPTTAPSPATMPATAPATVVEVRAEGNRQMSTNAVLALVKTRAGQPYDEEVVKADQRALLRTGRFENVVVVRADVEQGVIVTFTVSERSLVQLIRFQGNRAYKDELLRGQLPFGPNDPLESGRVQRGRIALEDKYKDGGYYFVEVRVDNEALARQQVVYTIIEGPRVKVKAIRFEGNDSIPGAKLKSNVQTKTVFWPFIKGKLDQQQLADDVVALQNYYRQEGYLDVEVDRRVDFSENKKDARVTFLIHEGPRYRVADVRFEGNTIFADAELAARLKMVQGSYYTALDQRRDNEALDDAYGQIGYMEAFVDARTVFVDPEAAPPGWLSLAEGEKPALLTVVYDIREGEQFRVGRVTIRGNDVTQDRVIRRQLQIFPEQLYDTVAVRESREALLESRLFDSVTLSPYGDQPGVRNVLVTVQEGSTAEFIVGVGITTNSGVLGNISLAQRNFSFTDWPDSFGELFRGQAFKGGGQIFRFSIEPGTELIRARVDWREPYLLDRPISLGTGLYVFTRPRETYDESRVGAQVSLGKQFKNRWYGELASRVEDVRIDNLDDDAPPEVIRDSGDNLLVGLKGTLVRDRTDSRWLPSKGDRLSFSYEQFLGDNVFGQLNSSYTRYFTLYVDPLDRKHILAARGEVGVIPDDDAPVFESFYGGGLGSLRGFEYRGISPRSAGTDEPIGGNFMTYAGAEYTFPVYGQNLRGVVFLDSGTVEESCSVGTWRVSAGVGLRLLVPFFGPVPMSLDFGIPLNKDSDDDTQLVSFAFGWVF